MSLVGKTHVVGVLLGFCAGHDCLGVFVGLLVEVDFVMAFLCQRLTTHLDRANVETFPYKCQ